MARKTIFELLSDKWNLSDEIDRLSSLFRELDSLSHGGIKYSLEDFVDTFCFHEWKHRNRYIDVEDFLDALEFDVLIAKARTDEESFLSVIEVMYNFHLLSSTYLMKNGDPSYSEYPIFNLLRQNMDSCLSQLNHEAVIFNKAEQVLISEKDPAATAVAEISNPETAYQVIQYNHHGLKGDISTKKKILLYLAAELEPKRKTLDGINKTLSTNIFSLLNNLNIRHNNTDPASKDFRQFVFSMSKETLEDWYDELYQMILLANLELDNVERNRKVEELKTHF